MIPGSFDNWLRSGCDSATFPEVPEKPDNQRRFVAELAQALSVAAEEDVERAVGVLPSLLWERVQPEDAVRALDEVIPEGLSTRKRLLLGELAVDLLISGEDWESCLPRLDDLIRMASEAGIPDELVILLNYRGVCNYRLAIYPEACSDLEESLRLADEIGSDMWRARAHINLGLVHKETGQLEEAAGHYRMALDLAKKTGDKRTLLACHLNIGNIYKELGKWEEGRRALESGIALADQLDSKLESIRGLLNLGVLVLEQGKDLARAVELFRRVVEGAEAIDARQLAAIARSNLGLALVLLDRPDEALEHLETSLAHAEATSDPEGAWRARANIARAHAGLGRMEEAERSFESALGGFEELWRQLGSDRERAEFQRNLQDLVADFVEHTLRARGPDAAFPRLAQSKGRVLRQAVEQRWAARVVSLGHEELLGSIRAGLEERPGSLILDYFISNGRLKAFACDPQSVTVHELPISEEGVLAELKEFSSEIGLFVASREYRDASWGTDSEAPRALRNLGDGLIEPILERISGASHLLVSPAGPLHHVPFLALADPAGEYLVERYAVSILPSSDFLAASAAREKTSPNRLVALRGLEEGLAETAKEIKALESVLGDALEVRDLGSVLEKDGLSGLVDLARGADALHFVGHAEFDTSDPYSSSLKLAGGGSLELSELLAGGVNLEGLSMVSLAACETGKGKVISGEEVIGLARGFLAAGVRSVLGSLWKVSDEATRELIPRFYRHWLDAKPPPLALQAAILEMLANRRVHPYFFAPFQVVGGW